MIDDPSHEPAGTQSHFRVHNPTRRYYLCTLYFPFKAIRFCLKPLHTIHNYLIIHNTTIH